MANIVINRDSSSSILSPTAILDKIREHYRYDDAPDGLEWAMSKKLERLVISWHDWFTKDYPVEWPAQILNGKDFRVFFLAFPIAGAHLLRVVEACYDIDIAFCATSQVAMENATKWKDMDQFDYLKWGDLIAWWEIELVRLQQDINLETPNRLLNSIRVKNIETAASGLLGVLPTFRDNFRIYTDHSFQTTDFNLLQKAVFDRERLLTEFLEDLKESVCLTAKRSAKSAEPEIKALIQDQKQINEGVMNRMPCPNADRSASSDSTTGLLFGWKSWCWAYMLLSILAHIVSRIILPSQPIASILLSFLSSLIPVVVAMVLVREIENAVEARTLEAVEDD